MILKLILDNSGNEDDAKDIFQETIIAVFKKIREESDYEIKRDFATYLYSIARWLWLTQLKRVKYFESALKDSRAFINFEEPEPFINDELRQSLYQKAFLLMPEDCQKIISMTTEGVQAKDIAIKLGVKSDNYIRKRRHFCKEFLIQKIKEDPRYHEGS